MESVLSVSPFRCRMCLFQQRLDSYVTEENCRAEIESFLKHGQLIPVLGRMLSGDPDHDIELIYGARRLFVARHLNVQLLVQVTEMSDRDAIVSMEIENRHRLDISPYERGLSYMRWLRTGKFQSQEDLARSLGVSASQMSRLLKLARMPSVIVNAFENPFEICEGWGIELCDALDDPQRRDRTVRAARSISKRNPRPGPREVYQELLEAVANPHRPRSRSQRDKVVRDASGLPLFRIRQQTSSIAILLPTDKVSTEAMQHISDAIVVILARGKLQPLDTMRTLEERPQIMLT